MRRSCLGLSLRQYGSEALGLAAFSSDIDLAVMDGGSSRSTRGATLRRIGEALRQTEWATHVDVREHARVPIVNFKDGQTGLEVDISLAAAAGLPAETTALVASLREEHTALEPLALILKVLLEQAGLNQPYTGGLGSFKLYVLIAHYLTQRNAAGQPWGRRQALGPGSLAELMLGLLRHAAENFRWGASLRCRGDIVVDFADVYRQRSGGGLLRVPAGAARGRDCTAMRTGSSRESRG